MDSVLHDRAREHLAFALGPRSKSRSRLLTNTDWRDGTVAMPTVIAAMVSFLEEERARGARGYRVTYQPGVVCPGCGGASFHVGRISAECAKCGTALPLAASGPAVAVEAEHG